MHDDDKKKNIYKNPTSENSHQRRKERIERHKKLTLQQYDNNTKNLFINNINDLKNTLKNKNKIMKKYSNCSTGSNSTSQDENEHETILEEEHEEPDEDEEEVNVENETYTYEYVTTKDGSAHAEITQLIPDIDEDNEYITECFEQTYSIIDILNSCEEQNRASVEPAQPAVEDEANKQPIKSPMRSSSSMSGLSSVCSNTSSSSSLSIVNSSITNATSSSSINMNSISPNSAVSAEVKSTHSSDLNIYDEYSNAGQRAARLNTELYYTNSRSAYSGAKSHARNLSPASHDLPSLQGMFLFKFIY